MVVVGADEGIDGDNAVATRTVLHHDGLTPARRELFGDQARADVGARTGAERQDELDRPLRPGLRRHRRHRQHQRKQGRGNDADHRLHVGHDVLQGARAVRGV